MFCKNNYFSKIFLTIEKMFLHIDEHQLKYLISFLNLPLNPEGYNWKDIYFSLKRT